MNGNLKQRCFFWFHRLNWLSVKKLLHHRDSILTYKCLNELTPECLSKKFIKRSRTFIPGTLRCVTHSMYTYLERYKTATGQCTFIYRATRIWNSLDKVTKEIKSLRTFKAATKNGFIALIDLLFYIVTFW